MNGTLNESKTSTLRYNATLPVSPGVLVLGDQNLVGSITNLFVHSRELSDEEIMESYKRRPTLKGVAAGWWLFKGQAKSRSGRYMEENQ